MQRCREEFPKHSKPRWHGRHVLFEYVMLRGINDQPEHAIELEQLLKAVECKINLIVFNPHDGTQFEASLQQDVQAFRCDPSRGRLNFWCRSAFFAVYTTLGFCFGVDKHLLPYSLQECGHADSHAPTCRPITIDSPRATQVCHAVWPMYHAIWSLSRPCQWLSSCLLNGMPHPDSACRSVLIKSGLVCTVRDSRGLDEMAACGQLGNLSLVRDAVKGPLSSAP
jgi:hypothetical protein